MGAHADADDAHLGDVAVGVDFASADLRNDFALQDLHGLLHVALRDRKREVGGVNADVLNDHVHVDVVRGHRPQNLRGDARVVRHLAERDLRFIARAGNAVDNCFFHFRIFLKRNQGAALGFNYDGNVGIGETGKNSQGHAILARKLHAADLQHLAAEARKLQHFFKADGLKASRLLFNAGVRRVNAVHVRKDEAFLGLKRHRKRHARRVRAAAPQGRDVSEGVNPLEARYDHDASGVQFLLDPVGVNRFNARLRISAVGVNRHLRTVEAHGVNAARLQGHREKPD